MIYFQQIKKCKRHLLFWPLMVTMLTLIFMPCANESGCIIFRFADVQSFVSLTYSAGGGLGMGVSSIADCMDKYKSTQGAVEVCADGNATDNWDTPPAGGWGFYTNGIPLHTCTHMHYIYTTTLTHECVRFTSAVCENVCACTCIRICPMGFVFIMGQVVRVKRFLSVFRPWAYLGRSPTLVETCLYTTCSLNVYTRANKCMHMYIYYLDASVCTGIVWKYLLFSDVEYILFQRIYSWNQTLLLPGFSAPAPCPDDSFCPASGNF